MTAGSRHIHIAGALDIWQAGAVLSESQGLTLTVWDKIGNRCETELFYDDVDMLIYVLTDALCEWNTNE